MAEISRSWLKGDPERIRGHDTQEATVRVVRLTEQSQEVLGALGCMRIGATESGMYQMLYLTAEDAEAIVRELLRCLDPEVAISAAVEGLGILSDEKAIALFRAVLAKTDERIRLYPQLVQTVATQRAALDLQQRSNDD